MSGRELLLHITWDMNGIPVAKGNFIYSAGYWTPVDQLVVSYFSDWDIEVIGVKYKSRCDHVDV
jgi:hypothetical protein